MDTYTNPTTLPPEPPDSPPPETTTHHPPKKKKRTKLFRLQDVRNTPKIPPPFQVGTIMDITPPAKKKKPDPNAPKITRPCTECGKRFWSWKALFGHMRCHPERNWRGINPPPDKIRPIRAVESVSRVDAVTEEEELEVAASLLMLANGPSRSCLENEEKRVNLSSSANPGYYELVTNSENYVGTSNTSVGANVTSTNLNYGLITNLEYNSGTTNYASANCNIGNSNTIPDYNTGDNIRFECSSCKKVFGSRQALGGHRASHKNVKGCFAIHNSVGDGDDEGCESMEERETVALGHKCGICSRVFSSGQALGGHMRCHFEKTGLNCLDLNLPVPFEDCNDFNQKPSCSSTELALDLRLGI